MLWYAACRGINKRGMYLAANPQDWLSRDTEGRRSVYKAFGWGDKEPMPLFGTDMRDETSRQERRAIQLFIQCQQLVADFQSSNDQQRKNSALRTFVTQFRTILDPERMGIEADIARQYEQQMLLNGRFRPRDKIWRECLEDLATQSSLLYYTELHWLVIGGVFLLNGSLKSEQDRILSVVQQACSILQQQSSAIQSSSSTSHPPPRYNSPINPQLLSHMVAERITAESIQLTEHKGEMFSVKASEEMAEKAVARRQALALQGAKQAASKACEEGFINEMLQWNDDSNKSDTVSLASAALDKARDYLLRIIGFLEQEQQQHSTQGGEKSTSFGGSLALIDTNTTTPISSIYQHVGAIMALTEFSLGHLVRSIVGESGEQLKVMAIVSALMKGGKGLDLKAWDKICGTYEEHGVLSALFELVKEQVKKSLVFCTHP